MTLFALILALLALPSALDTLVRVVLFVRARQPEPASAGESVDRWLVIIPARDEGSLVESTLASVDAGRGKKPVEILLLLDGEDAEAQSIAARHGVRTVVKQPPGPTKGAALAWLAAEHADLLESASAVLLLDVGSRISPRFFDLFRWPGGADAVQTLIRGEGGGVGEAVSASERFAQEREDLGRQVLGWGVRLRGTGTVFRPAPFRVAVRSLMTQVEDLELSLLMRAAGGTLRIAPADVWVVDEKPESTRAAAAQRARWLAGRVELAIRHAGAVVRLVGRRPLEGLAFVVELFGRPLSLTMTLRFAAGLAVTWYGMSASRPAFGAIGGLLLVTFLVDLAMALSRGVDPGAVAKLLFAWLLALLLAPRALFRWMKARKS